MLYFIVTDNIPLLKVQMKLKEAMKKKFLSSMKAMVTTQVP